MYLHHQQRLGYPIRPWVYLHHQQRLEARNKRGWLLSLETELPGTILCLECSNKHYQNCELVHLISMKFSQPVSCTPTSLNTTGAHSERTAHSQSFTLRVIFHKEFGSPPGRLTAFMFYIIPSL